MANQIAVLTKILQQRVEQGEIEIPLLPEVANKALSLAQDPDSDASEMARLIQSDQSLAAYVMRIANSVAYTPLSNLVSLQQAIARLGMATISEIALAVTVGAKIFNTPGYEDYTAGIWRHALASSLWAKEIARHGRNNVEVAFLGGLLHSIGRPAILQTILELAQQHNVELSPQQIQDLENDYCHQVSMTVVKTWQMPTLVIEAVSHYKDAIPSEQAAHITVGSAFAHHMLTPQQLDKESLLNLPALSNLNLYQDEVEELLAKMEQVKGCLEGLSL